MKILSLEENGKILGYEKNILIPCRIYKASVKVKKNKKLNLLEETIFKLFKINERLIDDTKKLKKYLGFYSEDKTLDEDYTQIIQTAVKKIKDYRLDEEEYEEKIITFYQELYTGKVLPVVTMDLNKFTYEDKNDSYQKNYIREIKFKKASTDLRDITAYWYSKFSETDKISKEEALKTIYRHNLNKYENLQKIDIESFKGNLQKGENVLLHTKIIFLNNNEFVLTNGFSGDFSFLLTDIFKNECYEVVKILKEDFKEVIVESKKNVVIPFYTNDINIEQRLIAIEKNTLSDTLSEKELKYKKEKIIINLYDLLEYVFKEHTKELSIEEIKDEIKNEKFLNEIAKQTGFKTDEKLKIFYITQQESIKTYMALMFVFKPEMLKNIANKYSDFLILIDKLLYYRNGLKHSSKSEILEKIKKDEVSVFKEYVYYTIEKLMVLKKQNKEIDLIEKQFSLNNSYMEVEKDFEYIVWKNIPQDLKDMIVHIHYLLFEEDFNQNRLGIVNDVIVNLSSIFEYLFKNLYKTFYYGKKCPIKDDIIKQFNIQSEALQTVSEEKFELALKCSNASLGAYFLLLIYFKGADKKLFDLIDKLLNIRGHGNFTYEKSLEIKYEDLKQLYNKTKTEISKLIKEMYNG